MTRREEIEVILGKGPKSAQELANIYHCTASEIVEDLDHIKHSVKQRFKTEPASCMDCKFRFEERSKIKTPSKCPRCKKERILGAMFRIV